MNKIAIYSALFGNIDSFKEPKSTLKNCDYIYFTDNPELKSDKITVRLVDKLFNNTRLAARMIKVLPHVFLPEYEYSIWIDGSIDITTNDIESLIATYLSKNNLAVFKHMHRTTLQEEVQSCIERKKDNPYILLQQYKRYKDEGFSEVGLVETGVQIRRHMQQDIIKFNNDWWDEIRKYSIRDQISFPYVVWKNKFKYREIRDFIWENPYFKVAQHNVNSSSLTVKEARVDRIGELKKYISWTLNNL